MSNMESLLPGFYANAIFNGKKNLEFPKRTFQKKQKLSIGQQLPLQIDFSLGYIDENSQSEAQERIIFAARFLDKLARQVDHFIDSATPIDGELVKDEALFYAYRICEISGLVDSGSPSFDDFISSILESFLANGSNRSEIYELEEYFYPKSYTMAYLRPLAQLADASRSRSIFPIATHVNMCLYVQILDDLIDLNTDIGRKNDTPLTKLSTRSFEMIQTNSVKNLSIQETVFCCLTSLKERIVADIHRNYDCATLQTVDTLWESFHCRLEEALSGSSNLSRASARLPLCCVPSFLVYGP